MRKLIYTLFISTALIIGCSEKLNMEPTSDQELEKLIGSGEGLEYLKNGAYAFARRAYTRYFVHFAEMLADTGEIIFNGTYTEFRDLLDKSMVNSFVWAESAWSDAYSAINNCNLILDNIDVANEEDQLLLEGNARFIRGLLYFDLTRFFALPYGPDAANNMAIPLVLKGVSKPEDVTYPSKETVENVFDAVEEDLLFAFENLPEDENFFASKYSAAAILSRYFLTIEDYVNSAAYADSVIESGYFTLAENILDAFNHDKNGLEDVFAWQQSILDNEGEFNEGIAPFYASTNEGGRSDMAINTDFIYSIYDSMDTRGMIQEDVFDVAKVNQVFYVGFGADAYDNVFCAKWLSHKTNVNVVRLAEMYLTRAEANQMIIDNGGSASVSPVEDIKTIRYRAGIDTTGLDSISIDGIRMERYKELIFEGHRLHDNKRWKQSVWDFTYDAEELIVPIPKKEIDANPNLK